jgi:hypothetical protein
LYPSIAPGSRFSEVQLADDCGLIAEVSAASCHGQLSE